MFKRDIKTRTCEICGTKFNQELVEINHYPPKSKGGKDSFVLICPNCNSAIDQGSYREFDFEHYLYNLITENKSFTNTEAQKIIGSNRLLRADIYTETKKDKLFIEVKALSFLNKARIDDVLSQLISYKKELIKSKLVFAFPGVLQKEHIEYFRKNEIEIWDIPYISEKFANEIPKVNHPFFQSLFTQVDQKPIEKILIEKLELVSCGKNEWNVYQKLLHEILERLFCPQLSNPIYEHSDEFKVNRRDFILPNYAESGFWYYLRDKYCADFIVVDAKNYCKKVQKKDVLQICNYIKLHGAGLFGIIITRSGGDLSCFHTIKEMWAIQEKLIIVLSDEDIKQMLILKSVGSNPEDILKQKIEQFRLSV